MNWQSDNVAPMPRGGKRAGAGRPKGSKSRFSLDRDSVAQRGLNAALKTSRSPLEVILARMNGDDSVTDAAFQAAIAAAPYIHPRLASSDTTIKSDNTHRVVADEPMTAEEWTAKYASPANDAVSVSPEDRVDKEID
jgi:hypothetical protein